MHDVIFLLLVQNTGRWRKLFKTSAAETSIEKNCENRKAGVCCCFSTLYRAFAAFVWVMWSDSVGGGYCKMRGKENLDAS